MPWPNPSCSKSAAAASKTRRRPSRSASSSTAGSAPRPPPTPWRACSRPPSTNRASIPPSTRSTRKPINAASIPADRRTGTRLPEALTGLTAEGAPSILTQGDLMQAARAHRHHPRRHLQDTHLRRGHRPRGQDHRPRLVRGRRPTPACPRRSRRSRRIPAIRLPQPGKHPVRPALQHHQHPLAQPGGNMMNPAASLHFRRVFAAVLCLLPPPAGRAQDIVPPPPEPSACGFWPRPPPARPPCLPPRPVRPGNQTRPQNRNQGLPQPPERQLNLFGSEVFITTKEQPPLPANDPSSSPASSSRRA